MQIRQGILLLAAAAALPALSGESAEQLAHEYIIVDTHIDVPYRLQEHYEDVSQATAGGDFDFPRAKAGGLDAAFMSIYVPADLDQAAATKLADSLIDGVESMVAHAPGKFTLAVSPDDVIRAHETSKIALPMGMENGEPVAGSLGKLRHFYTRGIRYITLAHSKSNHISDSSYDQERPWRGLSPFGKTVVEEMNRLGMMIDVSHISDEAFWQVIELSKAPVIASHSSARHFTPGFERNMRDEMIMALAKNGGVIQINFGSSFLTAKANAWHAEFAAHRAEYAAAAGEDADEDAFAAGYRAAHPYPFATLETVLDHIDHVAKIAGVDHVGLGSDYDGVGDSLPAGLKSVADYPNLVAGLKARGYANADIEKILGGNLLRVWREVESAARK